MEKPKWDVFRAIPRAEREAKKRRDVWMFYALQNFKLLIFVFSHIASILCTLCSKIIVLVLATNVGITQPVYSFFEQKCEISNNDKDKSVELRAIFAASLWFIQFFPDLCALIQCIWRITTRKYRGGSKIYKSIIVLETCRATGLYVLYLFVFPSLDIIRCVFLTCSALYIPYFLKIVRKICLAMDATISHWSRIKILLSLIWPSIAFSLLLTGTYLWLVLSTPAKHPYAIPIGLVLYSIGFWESWVDVTHCGGLFNEIYQIKYGIRKLNSHSRLILCLCRMLAATAIMYFAFIYQQIPIGIIIGLFLKEQLPKETLSIFYVSATAIIINFFLRVCMRFISAMKLNFITLLHPTFLLLPLLVFVTFVSCNYLPFCFVAKLIEPTGLNWYCVRWANETKPFPDYLVTLLWFIIHLFWNYSFVYGEAFLEMDETLDEEHAIRLTEKSTEDRIKFRLEAHVFFDDVWEDDNECGRIPNKYFKLLFELLVELTNDSNEFETETQNRILVNTSYGGRLVVRLPAGTLLFVHLKDNKLIRHKKRWSQVMYMYYLLGHRIIDSHLNVEDRQLQADNTYLLAIDGDSKFEPEAVIKLLHLMNTKSDIGCACGRIHPIGNGVMVWYQKFEYAIAHWFQKAAEHVFGCVLCAPGCFSLFRASALMDDNVMNKYTKTASEARHFVQYDQGEDRWLSTLMLKQGYRIEYAAASDAETYAPEGFEEFFNQRRRWTPSSIANTLDLLADYKLATQNNKSISHLYILYQMIVIGFSMLGPAIIFTMLVFAQVAAFGIDSSKVMLYNAIPVCVFIFLCFIFESNIQLFYAKIASVVYAFIMLAVLVATVSQVILETAFSPTSMFVLTMVWIFLFASFLHPKEFTNIIFGSIFFLMIPSTYIFLSLYSLINLNVINWGTREAVAKAIGRAVEKESKIENWLRKLGVGDENSLFYKILPCFRKPQPPSEQMRALERKLERNELILQSIQDEQAMNSKNGAAVNMLNVLSDNDKNKHPKSRQAMPIRRMEGETDKRVEEMTSVRDTMHRGLWMDLEYLQSCDRGKLKQAEENFWDQLIEKYLKPIESTPQEQSENAQSLAKLRNQIAFTIILLNGLLVLAIYLIQKHKDVLSFQFVPHAGFQWTKMNERSGKFEKTSEPLKVDPLGMFIIFFLMGILVVQTIGMLIHRLNTLVEALHEVSEMEDLHTKPIDVASHKSILDEAKHMLDIVYYDRAHGADGYTRRRMDETTAQNNVLYKLQKAEEEPAKKHKRRYLN